MDVKLVLLGPKAVGKTSVFNRFVYDEFGPTSMTIGAYFGTKVVRVGASTANLAIWDTAGEEKFDSLTNFYCRNAVAALICYDITSADSFASLPRWIEKVCAEADPECQIVLLGNKLDFVNENASARRVETGEVRRLAAQLVERQSSGASSSKFTRVPVFEASAKSGDGVTQAFEALVELCVERSLQQARGAGRRRNSGGAAASAKITPQKGQKGDGGCC